MDDENISHIILKIYNPLKFKKINLDVCSDEYILIKIYYNDNYFKWYHF